MHWNPCFSDGAGWAQRDLNPAGDADPSSFPAIDPGKDAASTSGMSTDRGVTVHVDRNVDRNSDRADPAGDSVEIALATALTAAASAGRFDVVAQLAREFEARRLAASANIIDIETRRAPR